MNYNSLNDYELLSYVSDSLDEARDIVFEKYKPLIIDRANKLYVYCKNCGVDINDLIQEGMVGLNDAINGFSDNKDACFYTYALRCINSRIISLIVKSRRLKNKALNDSVYLELSDSDQSNDFGKTLADNSYNPEYILLNEEGKKEIYDIIDRKLNDFEKEVIHLKINGFKYKEIADILGENIKKVDNCIQRIKNKIKEELDDN